MRILYKDEDDLLVQEVHSVESDGDSHILLHGSVGIRFATGDKTLNILHNLLEQGYADLSEFNYSEVYENSY